MQQIPWFVSLRALQIIQFRNDDTCVWVMRETKRFLLDHLSHYPDLKLEWVSIDDDSCAEHIVRSTEATDKGKQKSKGKEKATNVGSGSGSDAFPILPVDGWDADSESDDEEEHQTVKLDTQSLPFGDIWGVKIFRKEITGARL